MTIKRAFRSVLLQKPGSYSFAEVKQNGNSTTAPQGVLFLVGESAEGAPGTVDGVRRWSSSQLNQLIQYYGSGPMVDAAIAGVKASNDPGIGGATEILTYQTNAATQASLELDNSAPATIMTIKDRKYGSRGNLIAVEVLAGTSANQRVIKITKGTDTETLEENAAEEQLTVQYTGAGDPSTLAIAVSGGKKVLTVATTGGAAEDSFSITLEDDLIIQELADVINGKANFTCTANTSARLRSSSDLDILAATDIKTAPVVLYRLQQELEDRVNESSALVTAELEPNTAGIPAIVAKTFLSGGARGASANSNFSTGLSKSLSNDWNVVIPCISRDASEDITAGETDPASTYTIAAVIAATSAHLTLRGSIKNRKEAQGMVGFRGADKAGVKTQAATTQDFKIQLFCQDVLTLDAQANLVWKQPHVLAAKAAGIRLGTDIGEPLTFKNVAINGAAFRVNADTGLATGDFDPVTDFEEMIEAGVTFVEPGQGGGFRVVVDNTTYGKDQSFVFNRGSVIEASFHIAKTIRLETENIFIGRKIAERVTAGQPSQGVAKSIREVISNKLKELNRDAITAPSIDAPQGFVEDSLTVVLEGNTARVSVEVKPVQGLDFILIEFSLGETRQIA